jgi:hypothetical protein
MSQSTAWENGHRVPVYDPRDEPRERQPMTPERSAGVLIRRLVGLILADPFPALGIECLALVTSIGYTGSSMDEIAVRHGLTRAAVSKRCVELCDALGIKPSRAMRKESNRERCKRSRYQSLTEPADARNHRYR